LSQIITLNLQFAQDSTGNNILSFQEAEELGWHADIHARPAEVFHWEVYHYHALSELYYRLGFDNDTDKFSELSLTQLGDEFHTELVTRFTGSVLK
jgi:hypothetical protein